MDRVSIDNLRANRRGEQDSCLALEQPSALQGYRSRSLRQTASRPSRAVWDGWEELVIP